MMGKEKKFRNYRLTFIVASLVFTLCLVQLLISHRLAATGELVERLEVKAAEVEQENVVLKEEISQIGSLTEISQKAKQLNLVRTSSILYLTSQIPVALGH